MNQALLRKCRRLRLPTIGQIHKMEMPELRAALLRKTKTSEQILHAKEMPDEIWQAYLYRCSLLKEDFEPGDIASLCHLLGKVRPKFLQKRVQTGTMRKSLLELACDQGTGGAEPSTMGGDRCADSSNNDTTTSNHVLDYLHEQISSTNETCANKDSSRSAFSIAASSTSTNPTRAEDFVFYMVSGSKLHTFRISDVAILLNAVTKLLPMELHVVSQVLRLSTDEADQERRHDSSVENHPSTTMCVSQLSFWTQKLIETTILRRCNTKTHAKDLALLCSVLVRQQQRHVAGNSSASAADVGKNVTTSSVKRTTARQICTPALLDLCFERVASCLAGERIETLNDPQTVSMLLHSFCVYQNLAATTASGQFSTRNGEKMNVRREDIEEEGQDLAQTLSQEPHHDEVDHVPHKTIVQALWRQCEKNLSKFRGSDLVLLLCTRNFGRPVATQHVVTVEANSAASRLNPEATNSMSSSSRAKRSSTASASSTTLSLLETAEGMQRFERHLVTRLFELAPPDMVRIGISEKNLPFSARFWRRFWYELQYRAREFRALNCVRLVEHLLSESSEQDEHQNWDTREKHTNISVRSDEIVNTLLWQLLAQVVKLRSIGPAPEVKSTSNHDYTKVGGGTSTGSADDPSLAGASAISPTSSSQDDDLVWWWHLASLLAQRRQEHATRGRASVHTRTSPSTPGQIETNSGTSGVKFFRLMKTALQAKARTVLLRLLSCNEQREEELRRYFDFVVDLGLHPFSRTDLEDIVLGCVPDFERDADASDRDDLKDAADKDGVPPAPDEMKEKHAGQELLQEVFDAEDELPASSSPVTAQLRTRVSGWGAETRRKFAFLLAQCRVSRAFFEQFRASLYHHPEEDRSRGSSFSSFGSTLDASSSLHHEDHFQSSDHTRPADFEKSKCHNRGDSENYSLLQDESEEIVDLLHPEQKPGGSSPSYSALQGPPSPLTSEIMRQISSTLRCNTTYLPTVGAVAVNILELQKRIRRGVDRSTSVTNDRAEASPEASDTTPEPQDGQHFLVFCVSEREKLPPCSVPQPVWATPGLSGAAEQGGVGRNPAQTTPEAHDVDASLYSLNGKRLAQLLLAKRLKWDEVVIIQEEEYLNACRSSSSMEDDVVPFPDFFLEHVTAQLTTPQELDAVQEEIKANADDS
ncbi:unnamed protein product [Amoebophrya sp. A120]|nr:unnamed protein product [Amoebophrya sp. A120]|eukprot:GSA120T00010712001.1